MLRLAFAERYILFATEDAEGVVDVGELVAGEAVEVGDIYVGGSSHNA